ncbi:MAG: DNA replication and repair protein RecF [Candidatus Cloacimonetes bacterium]|nr:DNA replication and repair protein RecF [Candidatus Cloacimonadota bacterium]
MVLQSINLTNFRNFSQLSLTFDDKGHVFFGKNGIGKTNLLEAISYCAYGKSFRSLTDLDLIKINQEFFKIKAEFVYHKKKFQFEATLDKKSRKLIKVNNTRLAKVSELYKYLKIVYFSQDDINLIEGSPKNRRQFFDMAISQSDYSYISLLKNYHQLLKQRNALLKTVFNKAEKRAWDNKLVDAAVTITNTRLSYLKILNKELQEHYKKIGYHAENVEINYNFSYPYRTDTQLAEVLKNELIRLEKDEIRYQRTLIGPHLDDFLFILDKRSIYRFGSHGQKRCFAIAVKLALAALITSTDTDTAILIFDDVLADLDEIRAKSIIDSLGDKNQIFIATPTPSLYRSMQLSLIDMERLKEQR